MENGNVADYLLKHPTAIDFVERLRMARETCSAMRYLHYQEILHLDLKAGNLLLDSNGCLKLTDFGLSRQLLGESLSYQTLISHPQRNVTSIRSDVSCISSPL